MPEVLRDFRITVDRKGPRQRVRSGEALPELRSGPERSAPGPSDDRRARPQGHRLPAGKKYPPVPHLIPLRFELGLSLTIFEPRSIASADGFVRLRSLRQPLPALGASTFFPPQREGLGERGVAARAAEDEPRVERDHDEAAEEDEVDDEAGRRLDRIGEVADEAV